MKSPFQRDLKKLSRYLVQIQRAPGMSAVFGFVIASSDEWVLLHSFNSEAFCLDGYDVLRHCDIRDFCFFDDPRYWRYRALRRLKIRPTARGDIRIGSVKEVLTSVGERFPIMSVHRETRDRIVSYVGPIVRMSERSFTMEDADYFGQWTGPRRLRYADVTRVCFDGGFLNASAMTAPRLPRRIK